MSKHRRHASVCIGKLKVPLVARFLCEVCSQDRSQLVPAIAVPLRRDNCRVRAKDEEQFVVELLLNGSDSYVLAVARLISRL